MAKLVNEGERWFLQNTVASNTVYLGLYLDDPEPGEDATLATITECSGTGYSRIAVDPSEWTIETNDDGDTFATAPEKTWTSGGNDWGTIYGYFICDAASGTSGNLIFVQHFDDGPYTAPTNHKVTVVPKIKMM